VKFLWLGSNIFQRVNNEKPGKRLRAGLQKPFGNPRGVATESKNPAQNQARWTTADGLARTHTCESFEYLEAL